ncbi:MAG: hypothetical protein IKU44_02895 [Firmicutes bacterium]|nr:hypothetical protein [Bacillota bacterium]
MFSQKKRINPYWLWPAVALAATACSIMLLIGYMGKNEELMAARASGNQNVVEQEQQVVTENDVIDEEDETVGDETLVNKGSFQSYYLVKHDKDGIGIYFSDESGKITELEVTTIVYETLSAEDQERFDEGVKLDSRDDLNKLLMDYES